jgi:hypothetical protein
MPRQPTLQDIALLQLDLIEKLTGIMYRLETMTARVHAYGYERGSTYAFTLDLTGANNGGKMVIIDFVQPAKSRNIGQQLLNTPGTPVSRVLLYNSGTDGVGFSTNRAFSDVDTSVPLGPNSAFEIETDFPCIHTLHLIAPAGDTTVKCVLIV